MEGTEILSPLLSKPQIQKQIKNLEDVVNEAKKRIDIKIASDPNIIKAIECVERFLRKKRRVCYGGQAINSLLPKRRRFYDPKTTVPDYDFFSPSMEDDVAELIEALKKDGFDDISKKLSMHEGTIKVYVNFIPVADCSEMNKEMFSILQKRAKEVDGILYCDADFLRMMMYLELSHPRGEVSRWKKVFERLTLLNHEYPVDKCSSEIKVDNIGIEDRKAILEFCVKRKSVMLGPEFIELFEKDKSHTHIDTLAKRGGPLIFLSSSLEADADEIKSLLQNKSVKESSIKIHYEKSKSDHMYNYVRILRKGHPVVILFEEDSCHAYTVLKTDGGDMRIGTPDTFLHLYYGLMIFGKKEKDYFQTALDCLVRKLYHISERHRGNPTRIVPSFGLRCSGHQRGIAELLKLKAERTEKRKSGKKDTNARRTRKERKL
jgi:hypothetical protein